MKLLISDSSLENRKKRKEDMPHRSNQHAVQGQKHSLLYSTDYKHSLKQCLKRGCDKSKLNEVIFILESGNKLPEKYRPHILHGGRYKGKGYWECHICYDWLLIWKQDNQRDVITIIDIGTHVQLFCKKKH